MWFFGIRPFVRIPYMSQAGALLRIDMTAQSMNNPVSGPVFHGHPVDHIIQAALCRKAEGSICDPCPVVRMRILVHIVIHVIIRLRLVFIPEKLAEAFRKSKGRNPFIDKLIYGKRNLHAFISSLQLFTKAISFHKLTIFRFLFKLQAMQLGQGCQLSRFHFIITDYLR